jgi:hypothetical protein
MFISAADHGQYSMNSLTRWFLALQLAGGIGIACVLFTVFARHLHRSATWIAFCISLVIYSVSYTLLSVFATFLDLLN